jgi:hypothetical protein
MKTGKKIRVCGSITKKESLVKIAVNVMEHTLVAEADQPYSNYYGRTPDKPEPNSLFLFTERDYTLEEALRYTQNIDICSKNKVNAASAVFQFHNQRFPAIRIRKFPDYQHLKMLQQCYLDQGVQFARKIPLERTAVVTVNKCFALKNLGNDIFLDLTEKNEGYILLPKRFDLESFEQLMNKVWNNSDCLFFDAAMGGLIIKGKVEEMVRVYSDKLDIHLLECVKNELFRWL